MENKKLLIGAGVVVVAYLLWKKSQNKVNTKQYSKECYDSLKFALQQENVKPANFSRDFLENCEKSKNTLVKPFVNNTSSSPIGQKEDFGNGLSVVYDIANCNSSTKKCPIIKVIKVQGNNVTSWYKENNKYFKRIESPLTPKSNAIEISEKQWIEQAISITPI
jgi:hypothetical protein